VDLKAGVGGAGITSTGEAGRERKLVEKKYRLRVPPVTKNHWPTKALLVVLPNTVSGST
jgi:hypothetical protein